MTELLEQAIAKLKNLTASEQDAIAPLILEELEDKFSGIEHLTNLKIYLPNYQQRLWLRIEQAKPTS
jgi:hypothetical protein